MRPDSACERSRAFVVSTTREPFSVADGTDSSFDKLLRKYVEGLGQGRGLGDGCRDRDH